MHIELSQKKTGFFKEQCQTSYIKYIFPSGNTCGAPDGYPLLVLQKVHRSYGRSVRAVNVLCDM